MSATPRALTDSRARKIKLPHLTDHSCYHFALQVKLGLLLERTATMSPHRSLLTRSIGSRPISAIEATSCDASRC